MVNVDLYSAIITKVSNALNTLVSGEKSAFQALSKGLIVLLCAEVVRQRVPDQQWIADIVAPPSVAVWLTWDAACRQHRWSACNSRQSTAEPCHADICAWWHRVLFPKATRRSSIRYQSSDRIPTEQLTEAAQLQATTAQETASNCFTIHRHLSQSNKESLASL